MIHYKVDTTGGQAGSPILSMIDGKLKAIGIHKGSSRESIPTNKLKHGVLFTKDIVF